MGRKSANGISDLASPPPQIFGTKKGKMTILDSNGSRFFMNENIQERKASVNGKEHFYRRPIPQEAMPKHIVTAKQAGIMLDQDGDVVDLFGRYSSMALEG